MKIFCERLPKNKEKATIPLRKETVPILTEFLSAKMPNIQAFNMPSKYNMARMLKADLVNTEIPYVDEHGRKFDFHALRHTFITSFKTAGTRVAQSLARHKSSKMTDRYTHVGLFDERAAIEKFIPDYSLPSKQNENAATGTDDFSCEMDEHNKPDNKPQKQDYSKQAQRVDVERVTSKAEGNDKRFLIRRSQVRVLPGVFTYTIAK